MMSLATFVIYGGFLFAMFAVVLYDFGQMRIPNWISLLLLGLFAGHVLVDGGGIPLGQHLMWGGGVFAAGLFFYMLGWLGAGDVKLAAVLALWMGPKAGPDFLVTASVLGGAFALALLALRRYKLPVALGQWHVFERLTYFAAAGKCPYGIPLAVAATLAGGAHFAG